MKARMLTAAAVAVAFGLAGGAHAATPSSTSTANCFQSQNWENWRGADANTIYFRVNVRDIYKVELAGGSNMVTDTSNHLISQMWGSSWICKPIDLDLKISDGHIVEPLFVRSITKLTPDQVAMIPKKFLP